MRGCRPASITVLTLLAALAAPGLIQKAASQTPALAPPATRGTEADAVNVELRLLLDAYAAGDFDTFDARAGAFSRTLRDPQLLPPMLLSWVEEVPDRDGRHLVAASVPLELALLSRRTAQTAGALVEIGCTLLQATTPSSAERPWHRLATEVAREHTPHALARLPDYGAPGLPAAIDLEMESAPAMESLFGAGPSLVWLGDADIEALAAAGPDGIRAVPPNRRMTRATAERLLALAPDLGTARRSRDAVEEPNGILMSLRLWEVADAFSDLIGREPSLDEAHLRLGQTFVRLARPREALVSFRNADATATTPRVRYLARLLGGALLERIGSRAEAIQAFRSALEVMPRAQSAALALAPLLFMEGDRDEASDVIEAAVRPPLSVDPLGDYWDRDAQRWSEYIAALRRAVR